MMGITPYQQAELSAETVLKLADTFGLFASFYSMKRSSSQYIWENSSFSHRRSDVTTHFFLSLSTPDGSIGHVVGQGLSQSALENAFHLARSHMQKKECLTNLIQHLQKHERNIPPLTSSSLSEASTTLSRQPFLQWEHHHRDAASKLNHSTLTSSLEASTEHHYSLRSDGITYNTVIQRMQGFHKVVESNRQCTYTTGYSAEFDECHLVDPLILSMNQLLQQEANRQAEWLLSGVPSEKASYDLNGCLVIDSRIMAQLLFARIKSKQPIQNNRSRVFVTVSPLEGTLGYNPFHPLGYIIPLSKPELANKDFDPLYQALYSQEVACFGNHIAMDVPSLGLDDSDLSFHHPLELLQQIRKKGLIDDEPIYFLQGVQSFKLDVESSTCALLPNYLYKYESGQFRAISSSWLIGDVNELLFQMIGGFGPDIIEYGELSNWSASVPQYAMLQLNHFLKENR